MTTVGDSAGGTVGGAHAAHLRCTATLDRIYEWSATTRSLFFLLDGARLPFKPGQFVSLDLPLGAGGRLVRPYSIASSPEAGDVLEICVDLVPGGPGSTYLFDLRPPSSLEIAGPFGSFVLAEPPEAEMVFIAQATGIAPIRPMVRRALERPGSSPIRVLHGAHAALELLYRDELENWGHTHGRFHYEPVLSTSGVAVGENPSLEELVAIRYVDADRDRSRSFWICGVGDLVRRLRDVLRHAGYERRAVRYEQW